MTHTTMAGTAATGSHKRCSTGPGGTASPPLRARTRLQQSTSEWQWGGDGVERCVRIQAVNDRLGAMMRHSKLTGRDRRCIQGYQRRQEAPCARRRRPCAGAGDVADAKATPQHAD